MDEENKFPSFLLFPDIRDLGLDSADSSLFTITVEPTYIHGVYIHDICLYIHDVHMYDIYIGYVHDVYRRCRYINLSEITHSVQTSLNL